MIRREPGATSDTMRVTFELPATIWADRVCLVGDFNDWNPQATCMVRTRDDENWHVALDLPHGREYQFRYLVNGTDWYDDWDADRYVPNPYGGDNSVVIL
jgi:1,4-alpha-glucan branching enzyme